MNNESIIANVAVNSGLYTQDQIEEIINSGNEIPLHTLQGWKKRGYLVNKGEHGIECQLWKRKKCLASQEDDEENLSELNFFLTKSFLFSYSQVTKY